MCNVLHFSVGTIHTWGDCWKQNFLPWHVRRNHEYSCPKAQLYVSTFVSDHDKNTIPHPRWDRKASRENSEWTLHQKTCIRAHFLRLDWTDICLNNASRATSESKKDLSWCSTDEKVCRTTKFLEWTKIPEKLNWVHTTIGEQFTRDTNTPQEELPWNVSADYRFLSVRIMVPSSIWLPFLLV